MKALDRLRWRVVKFGLCLGGFSLSFLYLNVFEEYLHIKQWEHILGYTSIIIPDTLIYAAVINPDDPFLSVINCGIKNSLGPSMLWYLSNFNWYAVTVINWFFILGIVIYMEKIAVHYGLNKLSTQLMVVLFLILPATIYYSIGALKELPMMFLLLFFLHGRLSRSKFQMIFAAVFLVLFRYQLIVILLLVSMLSFKNKLQLVFGTLLVLFVASVYPLMSGIDILSTEATTLYREQYGIPGSLGEYIENIRGNYFIISVIGVLVRTAQSIFEPIITYMRQLSFHEGSSLSVFSVVQVFTILIILPYFLLFFKKVQKFFRLGSNVDPDIQYIYTLLVLSLVLIGGFSFIHHRYLYPFFPLIMIASLIPSNSIIIKKSRTTSLRSGANL